jgi:hypothetical protein
MQDQLDATYDDLLAIRYSSTCFGRLYAHHQESRLRVTAYDFLSWLWLLWFRRVGWQMSALCRGCCLYTVHTSATRLSGTTTIARTGNHRQWHAVCSPDDGHKDARNMLRNNWLPINHYFEVRHPRCVDLKFNGWQGAVNHNYIYYQLWGGIHSKNYYYNLQLHVSALSAIIRL